MVHAITQIMAEALVLAGHEAIIIDDCNVSNVRRQRWYDLAKRVGATVHFRVFSTDPDECKRRATATGQEDLLPVIDRMARDWDFCSVDWKYDG
jgi:predicted kinase